MLLQTPHVYFSGVLSTDLAVVGGSCPAPHVYLAECSRQTPPLQDSQLLLFRNCPNLGEEPSYHVESKVDRHFCYYYQ
ncbi:MAG: hypothetical protein LUD00_09735 [Prevotellaceae bacterium]|nr:hypothetical protein [Prevotellaceae bacterium]